MASSTSSASTSPTVAAAKDAYYGELVIRRTEDGVRIKPNEVFVQYIDRETLGDMLLANPEWVKFLRTKLSITGKAYEPESP